ncbi:hypothetical protein GWA97_00230 [Flavobacterium sp. LaA7.5]|nr:hypothetical protein [Flavobacterium salilacus subsp. altitudinum]
MKVLKFLTLTSFLLIYLPTEKFGIFNAMVIALGLLNVFNPDVVAATNYIYLIFVIAGIVIMFNKKTLLSIIGHLSLLATIIPYIKISNIQRSPLFVITLAIFLLFTGLSVYKQLKEHKIKRE